MLLYGQLDAPSYQIGCKRVGERGCIYVCMYVFVCVCE